MSPKRAARNGKGTGPELFSYEVRREGRPFVTLRGIEGDGGHVTVAADLSPAAEGAGESRTFEFESPEQAKRFVDEALLSLEYLDCVVPE